MQAFIATQVPKHGFGGGKALGDHAFAEVGVNFQLHFVAVAGGASRLPCRKVTCRARVVSGVCKHS